MNDQPKTSLADLLKESVLFQGALAVICLVGTFVLLVMQINVPQYVYLLDGTVVGFFFGARNLLTARNGAQEMSRFAEKLAVQNAEIVRVLSTQGIGGAVGTATRTALDEHSVN